MSLAYSILVFVHVVAGTLGLGSLPVPLLARKGGRVHRRAGWVFTAAMSLAAATALVISLLWLIIPAAVLDLPGGARHDDVARRFRIGGAFFLLLSLLAAHTLASGIRSIRCQRQSSRYLEGLARALSLLVPAVGAAVATLGVLVMDVLLLAFGGFAAASAIELVRPRDTHPVGSALIGHIEGMLAAATVAVTAFTVQLAGRLADASFAPWVWAVPVLIGMAATQAWKRSILRRRR